MSIKKQSLNFFLILLILVSFSVPIISSAQDTDLIPCGTQTETINENGKEIVRITNPCEENGFSYLLQMINNVINFLLFKMAVPIAAIMFAYAGFVLITSGGDTSKRKTAKSVFTNVAIGLVLAIASWLIINTILSILGFDGSWIGFTG